MEKKTDEQQILEYIVENIGNKEMLENPEVKSRISTIIRELLESQKFTNEASHTNDDIKMPENSSDCVVGGKTTTDLIKSQKECGLKVSGNRISFYSINVSENHDGESFDIFHEGIVLEFIGEEVWIEKVDEYIPKVNNATTKCTNKCSVTRSRYDKNGIEYLQKKESCEKTENNMYDVKNHSDAHDFFQKGVNSINSDKKNYEMIKINRMYPDVAELEYYNSNDKTLKKNIVPLRNDHRILYVNDSGIRDYNEISNKKYTEEYLTDNLEVLTNIPGMEEYMTYEEVPREEFSISENNTYHY